MSETSIYIIIHSLCNDYFQKTISTKTLNQGYGAVRKLDFFKWAIKFDSFTPSITLYLISCDYYISCNGHRSVMVGANE